MVQAKVTGEDNVDWQVFNYGQGLDDKKPKKVSGHPDPGARRLAYL